MARVARRKLMRKNHTPCRTSRPPIVVIAPDSFKASLDAPAISPADRARPVAACGPTPTSARARWPTAAKGTLRRRAVAWRKAPDDERHRCRRTAPRRRAYGIVAAPEGPTAIVEAAQIVGITDADGMAADVTARSTKAHGRNDRGAARTRACAAS